MTGWLQRNLRPIAVVLLASALVIGAFEVIDALTASAPVAEAASDDALEGAASVAGLIKVTLFLGVGALIAVPIRRGFRASPS